MEEAALKPLRSAAVKVKGDVELLVRDPKEFAKQKKCEVCYVICCLLPMPVSLFYPSVATAIISQLYVIRRDNQLQPFSFILLVMW